MDILRSYSFIFPYVEIALEFFLCIFQVLFYQDAFTYFSFPIYDLPSLNFTE